MLIIAVMILAGCGPTFDVESDQGNLLQSFKEPSRKVQAATGMVYDNANERMITYDVPKFAFGETVRLSRRDAAILSLETTLKDRLPDRPTGYLAIEAHFESKGERDDPPVLVYLHGLQPIPGFDYTAPGKAIAISASGVVLGEIGTKVQNRLVQFSIPASLVDQRQLFAVVIRFLPNDISAARVSGGFSAAHTDVLRSEYLTSIMVPNLPFRAH